MPSSLQHLTASFAFWGESFLFTNHTHGSHCNTLIQINCKSYYLFGFIKSFQACPTFSTTPTPSSTCPPTLPLDFSLSSLSVLQCAFSRPSGERVEDCNEGLRIHSIDKVLPMTICPPQKPLHLSPWILADAKRLHTLFSSGVSEKHD